MTKAYTTDDPGFVPLVAKMRAAKTIQRAPNTPETYNADAVFVMSPKSALAVQQLSTKEVGKRIGSIDQIHLPYKSVVVEMPLTPEIRALRTEVAGPGKMSIARVAARMTEQEIDGVKCMSFWPFWEFDDGALGFGAVALLLASSKNAPPGFKLTPGTGYLYQRTLPAPPLMNAILASGIPSEVAIKKLHEFVYGTPGLVNEAIEEITPLMFMWESIINCKSGITTTNVKPQKTGKLVLGRRKKIMANTEYTVVSLSAVESVTNGKTSQRADVEAHLVRGHFKRRKSGVYWWSPFIRGTGEVRHRKAYVMEGVPA